MFVEHLHFEEYDHLESTQDYAKNKIDLKPFTVISALHQTKGHGRYTRQWLGAPGDIAITIAIPLPPNNPEQLSFVVGLAVAKTLNEFAITTQLKWVNDVLVAGKKIAGILLEKHQSFLLIGIGININPSSVSNTTSVNQLSNATRKGILAALLTHFERGFNAWSAHGFTHVRNEWLANAYLLGEEIKVNFKDKVISGVFENIDSDGKLILKTAAGAVKISAGEIYF
ncbi:MAG: biotin--[acetyl-CoA-carboxylase] ligase [Rickettsiales bacterium]